MGFSYTIVLILEGLIRVLTDPKNSHSNSRANCCNEVFAIVSFFHFSSLPGTSNQWTSMGMYELRFFSASFQSLKNRFIPLGVDTTTTFVDLPDEMVGYTELKKSSATLFGTNANSSRKIMLYDPPRTADEEVDDATTREPFSKSTDPLFHDTTPCCIH